MRIGLIILVRVLLECSSQSSVRMKNRLPGLKSEGLAACACIEINLNAQVSNVLNNYVVLSSWLQQLLRRQTAGEFVKRRRCVLQPNEASTAVSTLIRFTEPYQ